MTDPIILTIPGEPFAWHRARVRVIGKFAQHFEAPQQKSWKGVAIMLMQQAMAGRAPIAGPVALTVCAYFSCPKSDERKREPRPERWSMSLKDLDNICKSVGDAGNGVLWMDDRQVCMISAQKRIAAQGQPARMTIEVVELEPAT